MSKITRQKRKDNFTFINNNIFKQSGLSWKAKGLLCHLISLPDDWQVYVSQLSSMSKDGKESTASGIKELINAGYILRRIERDEKGKFKGYDYLVSDEPEYLTEEAKPVDEIPENGKPENGEPATTNNLPNKELKEQRTNNTYSESFLNFWNEYHKITKTSKTGKPKQETFKHWKKLTNKEKHNAIATIQSYYNSVSDKKYLVIARTYLAKKRFNDEYETSDTTRKPQQALYIYKVGNSTKRHSDKQRWLRDRKNFLGNGYEEIKITA